MAKLSSRAAPHTPPRLGNRSPENVLGEATDWGISEQLYKNAESPVVDSRSPSDEKRPVESQGEGAHQSVTEQEVEVEAPNPENRSPTTSPHSALSRKRTSLLKKHRRSLTSAWAAEEVRPLTSTAEGHSTLATFLDSNEGYMIFRRFGYLQTRLLLEKQAKLSNLEQRFLDLDTEGTNEKRRSSSQVHGGFGKRQELLDETNRFFLQYAQLMTAVQQIRSFEEPTEHNRDYVWQFLERNKPIGKEEASWIHLKEDLVVLRPPKEPDWLEARIEAIVRFLKWSYLTKMFTDERSRRKSSEQYQFYSASRISALATAIVAFVMADLLVLPVLLCYVLVTRVKGYGRYASCIGILFFFTLLFASTMAFYSKAKRHEALAATAAYCAVIVVFLGNAAGSGQ